MKTVVICVIPFALAFVALIEYPHEDQDERQHPSSTATERRYQGRSSNRLHNRLQQPPQSLRHQPPWLPANASRVSKNLRAQRIQLVAGSMHWSSPLNRRRLDCRPIVSLYSTCGLAAGCATTIPKGLLNPFGAVTEEDANLYCTVGWVSHAGFLLTQCELTASDERRMEEREYELETGKSVQ